MRLTTYIYRILKNLLLRLPASGINHYLVFFDVNTASSIPSGDNYHPILGVDKTPPVQHVFTISPTPPLRKLPRGLHGCRPRIYRNRLLPSFWSRGDSSCLDAECRWHPSTLPREDHVHLNMHGAQPARVGVALFSRHWRVIQP